MTSSTGYSLQPDWVFEVSTMQQKARGLLQRPKIEVELSRGKGKDYWKLFAPYHYMNAKHNSAALVYIMFMDNEPICFNSILHYPHPRIKNIKRLHRVVTLPDYQGIGFAHVLMGTLGAAHKALGNRLRAYPKHPPFVRTFYKNKEWKMIEKPKRRTSTFKSKTKKYSKLTEWSFKPRFTGAIFEYKGPSMDLDLAQKIIKG